MAEHKILVLGGTGPAGICLLRELVYRHHSAIVYARNPSKIPDGLNSHHLLEVSGLLSQNLLYDILIKHCHQL